MILIMNYLIKLILLYFLIITVGNTSEINSEKIHFKINNKIITSTDIKNRNKYYKLIFNNENYNQDNLIDDLISVMVFNEYFMINNKSIKYNIDESYDNIFKKYENKEYNPILHDIFNQVTKENLLKFLHLDLKRKFLIEEILNSKKELSLNDFDETDLLYNINLKYFIVSTEDYEFLDNNINLNLIKDHEKITEILKKNKIQFIYKDKIIKNKNNIDDDLKSIIELNNKNFSIQLEEFIIFGIMQKKLKTYEGINVKLINLKTTGEIDKKLLTCNKINEIDKSIVIDMNEGEYEYNSLNNLIKDNLYFVNNYIKLNVENTINYIMLCEMKFDKDLLNQISINQKINSIANEIENEFVKKYSRKYNLVMINE